MSPLRLAVTEVALARHCARKWILSRDGYRVWSGGSGIGTAAHAMLAAFVAGADESHRLRDALERAPPDEPELQLAVAAVVYREFFQQAGALAPKVLADDLVELGSIAHSLSVFLAALLIRARRAGHSGGAALKHVFEASEKPVEISLGQGDLQIAGTIDLLCRDPGSGELYVAELKTRMFDEAAEEQVRLYSSALRREGIKAVPALLHLSSGQIAIKKIDAPEDDASLEQRLLALRLILEGHAAPPAAQNPAHCRECPVQGPCWSRWGRTLAPFEPGPTEPIPSESPAASSVGEIIVREARALEKVLRAHKIPIEELDPALAIVGPSVVRYRVKLRVGSSVSKLERISIDLQRDMNWLAAPRVESGPGHVSIDAPRAEREIVSWSEAERHQLQGLRVPIGLTIERGLLELDLAEAPHLLVAGSTGSGKTVFLQSLALTLLKRADCRVVIVDPKMVDFSLFTSPRLYQPVVTDREAAVELLQRLAEVEYPARQARLLRLKLNDRKLLGPGEAPMPAIVVVIDEFRDLIESLPNKAAKAAFVGSVEKLLRVARYTGIHLVLATQRATVDAVPGQLKSNLPVRIAFQLPDAVNSQVILDEAGAETLLGKGDLLMHRDGKTTRAQGFHVTAEEIRAGQG